MPTRDSFDRAAARSPVSVKKVTITLSVTDGQPHVYAVGYLFDVLDANGEPMDTRQGDLIPHLTQAQRTALAAFVDSMLAKAQGAVS